jgi:hypothetical protein
MRPAGIVLLCSLIVAGCGVSTWQGVERGHISANYHLLDITPQRGQSADQLVTDRDQCERAAVETPDATSRTVLSQTVPYYSIAMMGRQYSAWRECMDAREYNVTERK